MSSIAKRGTAAALTAVAAAATGVVTNIATNGAAWSWWAALIVLVTVGAALEYYLSRQPDESGQHTVAALGAAQSQSAAPLTLRSRQKCIPHPPRLQCRQPRARLHWVRGVAVRGDAAAPIETEVGSELGGQ